MFVDEYEGQVPDARSLMIVTDSTVQRLEWR